MRTLLIAIICVLPIVSGAQTDPERIEAFIASRADQTRQVQAFRNGTTTLEQAIRSTKDAFKAWEQLPEGSKEGRFDQLNRMWFELASIAADKSRFREAADLLEKEMEHQYNRRASSYLSGQSRSFFQSVVLLEAQIMAALGPGYYPAKIDHYLMPVHLDGDAVPEFVTIERVLEKDEKSFLIPPVPAGVERKVIHLVQRNAAGEFGFTNSVEVLGIPNMTAETGVENGQAVLKLTGATHVAERNQAGIPVRYVETGGATTKIEVTKEGLSIQ